jgi:threonine aldolase
VLVDLRSDTVTRPTPEMRRAMAEAEVGDDEYGEDPTVQALQERFAALTAKDASLFVPSGTMANQIALRLLTRPGDAVVAGARQHVVVYEAGAGPINAGVTFLTVPDGPALEPAAVQRAIESSRHHQPRVGLIAIEDSHMASGGTVWDIEDLRALGDIAGRRGIPVHLDGARLWNAAVASGHSMAARAVHAHTVMCCLSKGLGAPVGSLLAGPADLIEEATLHRKRLGGAMRQAGIIAAAGLVALQNFEARLADDHLKARRLAEAVADRWPDGDCHPKNVQTNIVAFFHPDTDLLIEHLKSAGVLAGTIAPGVVRLVAHSDVDDAGIRRACRALASAP